MATFRLTMKDHKQVTMSADSQEAALKVYKEVVDPGAEIVRCEWLENGDWKMSFSI